MNHSRADTDIKEKSLKPMAMLFILVLYRGWWIQQNVWAQNSEPIDPAAESSGLKLQIIH